jgi:hypothetical protein
VNALQKAVTRAQDGLVITRATDAPPADAAITLMLAALLGELDLFARGEPLTAAVPPPPPASARTQFDQAPRPLPVFVSAPRPAQVARLGREPPSAAADVQAQPPRPPPIADPDSARKNLASIVAKLTALYERRASLIRDLLATWGALKALDAQMLYALQSLRWLGPAGRAGAGAALGDADDEAARFAAVSAMLQIGASDHVFARVEETPASVSPGTLFAFRVGATVAELERLFELGARTNSAWRVPVLAALAEHGRRAPETLLALLDEPDDEVAGGAAEILAWIGRGANLGEAVRGRARDVSPARRCALLFADVAFGSRESLLELRRLVDAGAAVTAPAIDALAIAGESEDAERLTRVAACRPELAPLAVLAAGHLGNPTATAAIAAVEVDGPLRARALRTIQGVGPVAYPERRGARVLYGEPWTLARALGRLAAPDEMRRARGWYALEIAVRSGARAPVLFDSTASADIQETAAEILRAAIGGQHGVRNEVSHVRVVR